MEDKNIEETLNDAEERLNNEDILEDTKGEETPLGEVESLQKQLEDAQNANKEYIDRIQRNLAEFDNFRKRTISEKAAMRENGIISAVEALLPVVDNFERAMDSVSEEGKQDNFYKGIEMIYKQMIEAFENLGVKEIEGVGSEFNPNVHNAVLHVEDESFGENQIAQVLQKGYKVNDKVVRPSMVKVAN